MKLVETADLIDFDDIVARGNRIRETIWDEKVPSIESCYKIPSFHHQREGKPEGSAKGKIQVPFSGLCTYHVKFHENTYKYVYP